MIILYINRESGTSWISLTIDEVQNSLFVEKYHAGEYNWNEASKLDIPS